jgi:uncharacterized protein
MPLLEFKKNEKEEKRYMTLSLLVTDFCNLNCAYCYEKKSERTKGQMNFYAAKNAITHYMDRDDEFEDVVIEIFGGEPLLAFPLIKRIFEWFYSRSWKKKAHFSLVTNGTILNQEIKEWLVKNSKHIAVAFTIDGCKKVHDLNRCGSYDLVYANIPFFRKYWSYQPTKFTINDKTIPYIAENVIQLENMKLNFNGGIVLEDIWGGSERKKELLKIYEEQLAILVDFYSKRPDLYPPQPLFGSLPEYLSNTHSEILQIKKESVRFCGAGHEMVAIDVNGNNYPCHRFLPLCTGKPDPSNPVNMQYQWKPDKCAQCKFIVSCPTCAGFNYQVNGDTAIRTTFHCEAFKLGILATCKLEGLRLSQVKDSELETLSQEEKESYIHRLDAIINIIENGISE